MNTYLLAFAVAALTSLIVTRVVRDVAIRIGWVDEPDHVRKLHVTPIPPVGGISIALSMAIAIGLAIATPTLVAERLRGEFAHLVVLSGLALAMLLVGLWDDIAHLSPWRKFIFQILIASVAWRAGITIAGWKAAGLDFGALSLPITVLWIVGITNAFNLIDGIDGLASGAALFATMALLVVSIVTGNLAVAAVLAALAGATAGFLRYNFNPASIFLGDSGSLFLGFMLSVLSIESSQKSTVAFAVAVPIVSLGLPVLDTTVVIVRRLLSRQPLFRADRRHIHHILLERGFTPRQAVMWLYGVCGVMGIVSMVAASTVGRVVGPMLAMLGIGVGIGLQQLRVPELDALNARVVRAVRRQRGWLAGGTAMQTLLGALGRAEDLDSVLIALANGLEAAGFVSATLEVPRAFNVSAVSRPAWHAIASSSNGSTNVVKWTTRERAPKTLVTIEMPIAACGPFSKLALTITPGELHQGPLIAWIANNVCDAVGAHLVRVCAAAAVIAPSAQEQTAS